MSQNKKQKSSNKNKLSRKRAKRRSRSNSHHSVRTLQLTLSTSLNANADPIATVGCVQTLTSSKSMVTNSKIRPPKVLTSAKSMFANTKVPPFSPNEYESSVSSTMDFDMTYLSDDSKEISEDLPIHVTSYNQKQPNFKNPLSTLFSVGFDDLDDDKNEIKTADIQNQDPRTKQECKHILFLYNSRSGGKKALSLLKHFRAYTPLMYDLFKLNSSQKEIDKLAHDLAAYEHKVIVCIVGGDGSQSWATSLIDRAIRSALKYIAYPTIIPFPVGTGNDLSRALGWGCMERTANKIIKYIADAEYCYNIAKRFSVLDRWHIEYSLSAQYINNTFSPPLPAQFLCYLSVGYDAMITYKFAMERQNHPEKFKSQFWNQREYLKMGLKEFVSPSRPVNDSIELYINGQRCTTIPSQTRSLKLVNINSAASGVFFWGYLKSNPNELQEWQMPQLDDGLIEVMATHGSSDLVKSKTKMGHAHRLGQCNDIKLKIVKTPCYLQIDGEGWCIEKECTLNIGLYDQLPTLVGYKYPRGVYYKYLQQYYDDEIKEARHRYRDIVKIKYNINLGVVPMLKKLKSTDDFDLNINYNQVQEDEKENVDNNNDKKTTKKWLPAFNNFRSWTRNTAHTHTK